VLRAYTRSTKRSKLSADADEKAQGGPPGTRAAPEAGRVGDFVKGGKAGKGGKKR
jgi:hypothetical protein